MNRVPLGILCGIAFGAIDASMVMFGRSPDKSTGSGALVGLLISIPDAIAMKSYPGILGTGLIFGALTGWTVKMWAT